MKIEQAIALIESLLRQKISATIDEHQQYSQAWQLVKSYAASGYNAMNAAKVPPKAEEIKVEENKVEEKKE